MAFHSSAPKQENAFQVPSPFAGHIARAGNLFLPIPFARGCKVTLSSKAFYNIVNYRGYPKGTPVETFTMAAYRAASYPVNPWEYPVRGRDTGYTYFFPLDASMVGKELDVVVLGMKGGGTDLQPAVWLTARELPFEVEGR